MASLNSAQWDADQPWYTPGGKGNLARAYGVVTVASAQSAADTMNFFVLPKGAIIIDGFLTGAEMDTDGTPEYECNVGYAGDDDALLDSGAFPAAAIAGYTPDHAALGVGFRLPFNGLREGLITLGADTAIIGTVKVVAEAGGTGVVICVADYVVP